MDCAYPIERGEGHAPLDLAVWCCLTECALQVQTRAHRQCARDKQKVRVLVKFTELSLVGKAMLSFVVFGFETPVP